MRLGVIGFGNMGSSIAKGFVNKNAMDIKDIGIFDTYLKSGEKAKEDGFFVYSDEVELVKSCDAVLVAVKPIHAKSLFEKISKYLDGKLVVSIVAGLEGEGVFALDSDSNATDEEKKIFEDAFFKIGTVEWVEERLFPVVTGLSGGGPAYVAMFIEALADAGVLHGLKRDVALKMAAKTVLGSAAQILETNIHPAVLKDMVCSPAGTTIEGVKALEDYGFRAGVIEAVSKATLKSMK